MGGKSKERQPAHGSVDSSWNCEAEGRKRYFLGKFITTLRVLQWSWMQKSFFSYHWTRIIIILKNKQIQNARFFYFQEGGKHEIDFSSPSVEGENHISNQALRLQPFLLIYCIIFKSPQIWFSAVGLKTATLPFPPSTMMLLCVQRCLCL